ncbi:MAG: hypothetical protein SFU56_18200 [Capsulimonadales bacterium]|nr:hypothetical protein [Capsulimonadales bacterium]
MELHLRRRAADGAVTEATAEVNPARTILLLCDVWDRHWCQGATERVNQLAPAIGGLVADARRQGLRIVHSPSDTIGFYSGMPARDKVRTAPYIAAPAWIGNWEPLDPSLEPPLPIDDSDGGCDCEPPCPHGSPWTRQHPAIAIEDGDAITDNGQEFFNLLAAWEIDQVLVAGVHTNMCVLGRPFGIRRLVKLGKPVALVRDLTDTMYNHRMPPFVPHSEGTARVIAHIERWWCPTIVSTDLTGRPEFRLK